VSPNSDCRRDVHDRDHLNVQVWINGAGRLCQLADIDQTCWSALRLLPTETRLVKSLGVVFGGLPRDPVFVQALSARAVTSWSVGVLRERVRTSRPR